MRRNNHAAALVTAVATITATTLTGCGASKSPKEQLDAITAVTGNQIFGIRVTAGGKTPGEDVSVGATHDGDTGYYYSDSQQEISNGSPNDPPAGNLVSADAFPLDTLVELAKTTAKEEDNCSPSRAQASITPSGAIAMWVECMPDQNHPIVDARSTLDGQPFTIPALDLTTTQGVTDLDQAVTKLLGNPHITEIQYNFHKPQVFIAGPEITDTQGQPCYTRIEAMVTQPTTPFPVTCQTYSQLPNSFTIDEYGPNTITNIITTIQNSPDIDQDSLTAITFTTDGTNLIWDANTSNLSDLMNHRDILKGTTPKH